MPATVADHRPAALIDLPGTTEVVRRCLAAIADEDRDLLWPRLEALERALTFGNTRLIDHVVEPSPVGAIRDCVAQLAARCIPPAPVPTSPAPPLRMPRPRRKNYERWSVRPTHGAAPGSVGSAPIPIASTARTPTGSRTHRCRSTGATVTAPRSAYRRWWLDDDGALCGEFQIGSTPLAQNAAGLAYEHAVAPSIGVRFDSEWDHLDPADWDPHSGRLDLCRHWHAEVEEVSLTPSPQLPTRVLMVL